MRTEFYLKSHPRQCTGPPHARPSNFAHPAARPDFFPAARCSRRLADKPSAFMSESASPGTQFHCLLGLSPVPERHMRAGKPWGSKGLQKMDAEATETRLAPGQMRY